MLCDYCQLRGVCRHLRVEMGLENPEYGEFCPFFLASSVEPVKKGEAPPEPQTQGPKS